MQRSSSVRIALAAALAVAALALTACGAGAGGQSSGPAAAGSGSAGGLQFTAPTVSGGQFHAASTAGRPTVLWFWAPWCVICRSEGPDVANVAARFEQVRFVGMAGRGEVSAMRDFVADTGTGGLTHVVDRDGSLWNRFGVITQPAFVFVDESGSTEVFSGSLGEEQLRSRVRELTAS